MQFHLVYNGSLRSSGNNKKPQDVAAVREKFHPQMERLWQTHNALKILEQKGARQISGGQITHAIIDDKGQRRLNPRQMAQFGYTAFVDLISPLKVGSHDYIPLVRESLHLSCELDILFLRQQDPGELISQGGDIDGRIKLLLDALRMPSRQEQDVAPPSLTGPIFCLMQEDTLVSRLNVDTDRLLFPETEKPDEVHLVIRVTLNVLQVADYNVCLL